MQALRHEVSCETYKSPRFHDQGPFCLQVIQIVGQTEIIALQSELALPFAISNYSDCSHKWVFLNYLKLTQRYLYPIHTLTIGINYTVRYEERKSVEENPDAKLQEPISVVQHLVTFVVLVLHTKQDG
jgi:hypothetical protein